MLSQKKPGRIRLKGEARTALELNRDLERVSMWSWQ